MHKKSFGLILIIIAPLLGYSHNFKNGSHLINMDGREYTVIYREANVPTTRICRCIKPTDTMKNGIVPARMRSNIRGFTITSVKNRMHEIEVTAVIAPETTVNCLSVQLISIEVTGVGTLDSVYDTTVCISNGAMYIADR